MIKARWYRIIRKRYVKSEIQKLDVDQEREKGRDVTTDKERSLQNLVWKNRKN